MAFFSPDEFDRTSLGNPWNVTAVVLLLLAALAFFFLLAGPSAGPFGPYPGPYFGYDAIP